MKITISDLGMTYHTGKKALENINLRMESPNLIGLIGPNGAGKTTLMKLLTASLLPTNGKIEVDNKPLHENEEDLKSRLGYLPQTFGLYDELTVYQFLDYIAALKRISNAKESINKVIADTNLTEKSKAKIKTLSGGQRQRVGIAQSLLGNPDFLIFDEPTVGLDPEERIKFRNLFSKEANDKLVLLSTHIIDDVQSVCNQLIVINHGKIQFMGTPEELIHQAEGHVGLFKNHSESEKYYKITSRINTSEGILCRCVAKELPDFVTQVDPTLEEAYMYLLMREEDLA